MKILVTGAAGFIGSFLSKALIKKGHEVVGIDNINNYYDPKLKLARLEDIGINTENIASHVPLKSIKENSYTFIKVDIEDEENIRNIFEKYNFDKVIHLAAQAGVRYSLENPRAYINSNVIGFFNIIESVKQMGIKHILYASSSSIYGMNKKIPFSTDDCVDYPISLYAATKKSNELIAHTYSHLYGIRTTGMRFFTVYGPWGRPDMAYFLFTEAIKKGEAINIFNNGDLKRDFTYIDDIIAGILALMDSETEIPSKETDAPYEVYNLGNNEPVKLLDFIEIIEDCLGQKAKKEWLPMQPGDVYMTYADIDPIIESFNYQPKIKIKEGLEKFITWHQNYYSN